MSHPYVLKASAYNTSGGLPHVLKALAVWRPHIYSNRFAPILLKALASPYVIILFKIRIFYKLPCRLTHSSLLVQSIPPETSP